MAGPSWCKVASNLDSHPKIRRAGREGREVFLFALRKNSEPGNPVPGRLPAQLLEPWYLADQLMMSETDAKRGVTLAVSSGLLAEDGDSWVICGWREEWGKFSASSTERVRRFRENKRLAKHETPVTVTETPTVSVKRGNVDQIRSDQTRSDLTQNPHTPTGGVSDSGPTKPKAKPKRLEPQYTPEELADVRLVLDKLGSRNGCEYTASKAHTALIVARLRDGYTRWDMRRIIAYCGDKLGWQDDDRMREYLRPEVLFGPKNIEKYASPARVYEPRSEADVDRTQEAPPTEKTQPRANQGPLRESGELIPFPNQPGTPFDPSDPALAEPDWMGAFATKPA